MSAARRRFTMDGSDALETHLAGSCEQVRRAVQAALPASRLRGLALGGGYGRGEGGVYRTPAGDRPYNDLEFYVFMRGPPVLEERRFRAALEEICHSLTPVCGVETELKITSSAKLRHSPVTMFYYDLLAGHRWLLGNDGLLAGCEHHLEATAIPLSEAARLLLNRCSGLLFSSELLERATFATADADFVGRNLAKAQLGLGDAVLTAHGLYHWSCRERHRRLTELRDGPAWLGAVREHHAAGVAFKLYPTTSDGPRDTLETRLRPLVSLAEEVWLWLERRRLGREFASIRDYASDPGCKCPELASPKNPLLHLRTFGWRALVGSGAWRYPRERLFRALAWLLFARRTVPMDRFLAQVQQALRTKETNFEGLVTAYRRLWNQYH